MKSKNLKVLLIAVLSILTVVFLSVGAIGCANGGKAFAFNENMKDSYIVNEIVNLDDAIDYPAGTSKPKLSATYVKDGATKKYLVAGLTFKPTNTGEVKLTVTYNGQSLEKTILITETKPTLLELSALTYEKGDTVEISVLENNVSVLPSTCTVDITKVRFAGGEAVELGNVTTYTFNNVGEYEFYFTAKNSSGELSDWMTVNVTREMTENEVNDLSNTIKAWGLATVEQVDEHSENSDWAWKATAVKTGAYANGANGLYWQSRVFFDFGEYIDLSKQYVQFDVNMSENVEASIGAHLYYATSATSELTWHANLGGSVNEWSTVAANKEDIRSNPDRTSIKVCGMFISVLHKMSGEYNPEDVYIMFDNMSIETYPEIGPNEVGDYTNKGSGGNTVGATFKLYTDDKVEGSDWSWKFSTRAEAQASDYPYVDVFFNEELNFSDYGFSFFVKGNDAYKHDEFIFAVLARNGNDLVFNGGYYKAKLEKGTWNYIQSSDFNLSGKFVAVRFMLNTSTMSSRDAQLLVDNLKLISANDMQKEIPDGSNRIAITKGNDISIAMSNDAADNSVWAWKVKGNHFDYFKMNFDKTYAFANGYFTMDIKPVSNFGGTVIAQFIASDGTVKKDYTFSGVSKTADDYITLDTSADSSILLANYAGVNLYMIAEDTSKPVEILIDNVSVKSKGKTEYVAIDADDWEISSSGDDTTVTLKSFAGGSKYVQYAKEGGYTNEFITVRTRITSGAPYLSIATRVPNVINWAGNGPYNYSGFYLKFNYDGNKFYTLYGPTFNGTHCGSKAQPALNDAEYDITFGVITNNDSFIAVLYIHDLEGNLIRKETWTTYPELKDSKGEIVNPADLSGSFVVYSVASSLVDNYNKEQTITISKPFSHVPTPTLKTTENKVIIDAAYADSYLVSVDDGEYKSQTSNEIVFDDFSTHTVSVKNVLGGVQSQAVTASVDTATVKTEVKENEISWDNPIAEKYLVSINGEAATETTETSMTFTEFKAYTVSVIAVKGTNQTAAATVSIDLSKPTLTTTKNSATWYSPIAEKYLVSINGETAIETTDTTKEFIEDGIYKISVIAVKGTAQSQAATSTVLNTDDLSLHNMTDVSYDSLTQEQGDITFMPNDGLTARNAATVMLKGAYGAGDFIKVGFTATNTKIHRNGHGISISFARNTDNADGLGGLYSLTFYEFASITIDHKGNAPINYTTEIDSASNKGVVWYGSSSSVNQLVVGNKYYIAVGYEGTGDNAVIHFAFFDSADKLITAAYWRYADMKAANPANSALPETGYFGIHSWAQGQTNLTYEVCSKAEMFGDNLPAPQVTTNGTTVSWLNPIADEYVVSINGEQGYNTTDVSKTFTEYGAYNVSVKAVIGGRESAAGSASVIYTQDDIDFYNMNNISFNGNAPTYTSGSVNFKFEYQPAYVHSSVARSSSAIVLNKAYTAGDFIKVGFTATTNSIKDATIGIGILGTTLRPFDSFAPSRHTLNTTKDGAGLLLGYNENRATNYLGVASASASTTVMNKISLNGGLTVGSKYYIVAGVENVGTDKVLSVAVIDANGELLNLYTLSQAAAINRNSAFGAFPESGHFAVLYFGEVGTSSTIEYSIVNREEIYGKMIVSGAKSYSITEANGVKTVNYVAADNVNETANWREGYGVSLSTLTKYKNEFVKVGFKPVQCRTDTADGPKTGLTLDDQRITIQYRAPAISNESHPSNVFQTLYYNNGITNVQISSNIGANGTYVGKNIGNLDTTKQYYIIAGVVTTETESTFYYVLTVDNGTNEQVLFSTSWVLGVKTANVALAESGYLVVNCATQNQTCLTYQILSETEGLAVVNSANG